MNAAERKVIKAAVRYGAQKVDARLEAGKQALRDAAQIAEVLESKLRMATDKKKPNEVPASTVLTAADLRAVARKINEAMTIAQGHPEKRALYDDTKKLAAAWQYWSPKYLRQYDTYGAANGISTFKNKLFAATQWFEVRM